MPLRLSLLVLAVFSCSLFAEENGPGEVQLTKQDGQKKNLAIKEINSHILTTTEGDEIELDEIFLITNSRNQRPVIFDRPCLWLANGDRIFMTELLLDETTLKGVPLFTSKPNNRVNLNPKQVWEVPLETVQGAILNPPRIPEEVRGIFRKMALGKIQGDTSWLQNGDQITGEISGLTLESLSIKSGGQPLSLKKETVRSFALDPELLNFPMNDPPRVIAFFRDGSILTITGIESSGDLLKLKTAWGLSFEVAFSQISALQILSPRCLYLSAIEPVEYHHTPFLSQTHILDKDRNYFGGPISLGNQAYARGISLHSQCDVAYELEQEYESFQATVGIDDSAGPKGSAVVVVSVDGEIRYRSGPLRAGKPPVEVNLKPLAGKRLVLSVEFGEWGDVEDHVNWGDARLVLPESPSN